MKIEDAVLEVLDVSTVEGNLLMLPGTTLDRKLYLRTNLVLEEMGGKWNRREKAHVFPEHVNVEELLDEIIASGEITIQKKELQYFPTPEALAKSMAFELNDVVGDSILEPSAGTGNLVRAVLREGAEYVTAVEIHPPFCQELQKLQHAQLPMLRVIEGDFLSHQGQYDRIIANPPFSKQQDIIHVNHMLDCLKPGGRLVSILSGGFSFRTDRRTKALKDRLDSETKWWMQDNDEHAFRESGTDVRTVMLIAEKKL